MISKFWVPNWGSCFILLCFTPSLFFARNEKIVNGNSNECEMMWAVQISKFGNPLDVIGIGSVPKPKIEKEDDMLVQVQARPVNPADLLFIRGMYMSDRSFPEIPGSEGTGIVEAVGKKVKGFKKGDRVSFLTGYNTKAGSWAEFAVMPEKMAAHVNKGLPVESAAQLVLNPLTMIGLMKQFGNVKPGEWVIQNAANSGCGKFLIQYLKAKGIKTINVVRHSESVTLLKLLGADEVIALDNEDLKTRVDEITAGRGVKYAIDCVWGQNTANSMVNTLSQRGKLITYGLLSGIESPVNVVPLLFGMRTIQGYHVGFFQDNISRKERQAHISEVGRMLLEKKMVLPVVNFRPQQIKDAIIHSELPKKQSKTLIVGTSLDDCN